MKTIFFIFLFFHFKTIHAQNSTNFYVDPKKTYGGAASQYFETIEYIPLETSKTSLFGTPTYLIVTDSSIVVGDADTDNILFFTLKGKFILKDHLLRGRAFTIEANNNLIVVNLFPVFTKEEGEVRTYTLGGKLINLEKKYFDNANIKSVVSLDSGFYAQQELRFIPILKLSSSKSVSLLQIYDKKNSLTKEFLKVDPVDYPFLFAFKGGVSLSPAQNKKSCYFVIPYDYSLYVLTKDSISKIGEFVFPASNVVSRVMLTSRNLSRLDSLGKTLAMSLDLIESVKNIYFHKDRLLFTLQKKLTLVPEVTENLIYDPLNFMYDTITKKAIVFEKIYPDSLSFDLPIMDGFSSISGMNYQNGFIYSSVSSLKLFQAKEKANSGAVHFPQELEQFFSTQNRKSNPVIVKMKLKTVGNL